MPRVIRGLADRLTYHVLNRGNGRQEVFHDGHTEWQIKIQGFGLESTLRPKGRPKKREDAKKKSPVPFYSSRAREVMVPWNKGRLLPGWSIKIGLEEGIKKMVIFR